MGRGIIWAGQPLYTEHLKACERFQAQGAALTRGMARHAFEAWAIAESGLPRDRRGFVTLEGFDQAYAVDKRNQLAVESCQAVLSDLGRRQGLTLFGGVGCGKTTLAAALGRSLIGHGIAVLFVNVPEFFEGLKKRFDGGGDVEGDLSRVSKSAFLILDDLGRERPSPWTVDQVLYTVVDHRYREGLPTVVTTNFDQAALEQAYSGGTGRAGEQARNGAVIVDRLREMAPWVPLKGSSRRGG